MSPTGEGVGRTSGQHDKFYMNFVRREKGGERRVEGGGSLWSTRQILREFCDVYGERRAERGGQKKHCRVATGQWR